MSTIHIDGAGQAAEFHEIVQSVSITHLLQQREPGSSGSRRPIAF
jgi:hypothetical protein